MLLTNESVERLLNNQRIPNYIKCKIDKKGVFTSIKINNFNLESHQILLRFLGEDINEYINNGNKLIFSSHVKIVNDNVVNKEFNFSNCIFEGEVNITRESFFSDFNNSVFKENVNIKSANLQKCSFDNSIFKNDLKFEGNRIQNSSFNNTTFCNSVLLDTNIADCSFNNSTFKADVKFSFISKTEFIGTIFEKQTIFTDRFDNVNFTKAHFCINQQFNKNMFSGEINFTESIFHNQVQFFDIDVRTKPYINYENAEFKQSLDISRSNLFKADLRFFWY